MIKVAASFSFAKVMPSSCTSRSQILDRWPIALSSVLYDKWTTPDSGRAIHVGPIHVHPIHVETDSGPIEPIHVWPYSCPNRFMPKKDWFMSDPIHVRPYSCPEDRFMSGPVHVRPHSCPEDRFMSGPVHVRPYSCPEDRFMSGPVHVRPHSCPKGP